MQVYLHLALVFDGPVPITTGTCGYPNIAINVDDPNELTLVSSHLVPLYGKAASRFTECDESNDKITCKKPVGANFSWNVAEVASKCWFGSAHCFNGSRSIFQNATISLVDLGTTRRSPLELTLVSECSHINHSRSGLFARVHDCERPPYLVRSEGRISFLMQTRLLPRWICLRNESPPTTYML